MSHFAISHFVNFRAHLQKKNCEIFAMVKDRKTGKVTMTGDMNAAYDHLCEVQKNKRRTSRDWVPVAPVPELPMPFDRLVLDQPKLRTYASSLLRHFMEKKQKLGKVNC